MVTMGCGQDSGGGGEGGMVLLYDGWTDRQTVGLTDISDCYCDKTLHSQKMYFL